jgi:GxxExxY protein
MVFKHRELTEQIIACFRTVYNTLGTGFSEKVYHSALAIEIQVRGMHVELEHPIDVYYKDVPVGRFYADLFVDRLVIVEIKAVSELLDEHRAQLLNYLKSTNVEVGLLVNFGNVPEVERKSFDNDRKGSMQWMSRVQVG